MKTKYSLTEIETHCRKAIRGAGLSWGLAEEAGKIARYLSAHKVDGPKLLANYIAWRASEDDPDGIPNHDNEGWQPSGDTMCPIIAGSIISDRATMIVEGAGMAFQSVAWPALMVPQLSRAAEATGQTLSIEWDGFRATASSDGILFEGHNMMASAVPLVRCALVTANSPKPGQPVGGGFEVEHDDWNTLGTSAHQTYAPASEESRLSGAGSGLNDND